MSAPPYSVANGESPTATVGIDPVTGAVGGAEVYNLTAISTAGTTTVNAGPGVVRGVWCTVLGTSPSATLLDGTSTLMSGTFTEAGQMLSPGVGIRYKTSLIAIISGTGETINVLWD